MTMTLPPAKAQAAVADRETALGAITEEPAAEPRRLQVAEAAVKRPMPRPIQLTPEEERELAGNQVVESVTQQIEPADTAAVQAAATETPAAEVVSASMPLPGRVIARTIQRIGYSCGQVASTTAMEGSGAGVFKVTCTSGHSYQATPIRGRYHFRRLGSR
jgi:hypothetical protein